MFAVRCSLGALAIAGLLASGPAFAADEPPVATANPDPQSVAAQIDEYLKTSPAVSLPKDGAAGITSGDEPRQARGGGWSAPNIAAPTSARLRWARPGR